MARSGVLHWAEHLLDPECISTPQDCAKVTRVVHILNNQESVPSTMTKGQAGHLRHCQSVRLFCWVKLLQHFLGKDLHRHTHVQRPLFQPCQVLHCLFRNPDFHQWVLRIECCIDLPASLYKELLMFSLQIPVLECPQLFEVVVVDTFHKLTLWIGLPCPLLIFQHCFNQFVFSRRHGPAVWSEC